MIVFKLRWILTMLILVSSYAKAQQGLLSNAEMEEDLLSISVENIGIKGPARIKFSSGIELKQQVETEGGTVAIKDNRTSLVWLDVSGKKALQIKLKLSEYPSEIGEISYLVEGDKVVVPIHLGKIPTQDKTQPGTKDAKTLNPIPVQFRDFDLDHDMKLNITEIRNAINDFFDGENDLSVNNITSLIDFFFDQ